MKTDSLPTMTIVTPSFNQGEYIGETIESVLSQNYPHLEFIIIDGGSTDDSVDVIRKYEKHLAFWVSEKDRGQSHAINKGYSRATGDVVNWLCSDDTLQPGALKAVGDAFASPEAPDVVVGKCLFEHEGGNLVVGPRNEEDLATMPYGNDIAQPSCFYRRSLVPGAELVKEDFHFMMDLELWARLRQATKRWKVIDETLSFYRNTGLNKSSVGGLKMIHEHDRICRAYDRRWPPLSMAFANSRLRLDLLRHRWRNDPFWTLTAPLWRTMNFVLERRYGRDQVRVLDDHWFRLLWGPFSRENSLRGHK
jgi:glycosyltransferase involved in cell wall biosynthesis